MGCFHNRASVYSQAPHKAEPLSRVRLRCPYLSFGQVTQPRLQARRSHQAPDHPPTHRRLVRSQGGDSADNLTYSRVSERTKFHRDSGCMYPRVKVAKMQTTQR